MNSRRTVHQRKIEQQELRESKLIDLPVQVAPPAGWVECAIIGERSAFCSAESVTPAPRTAAQVTHGHRNDRSNCEEEEMATAIAQSRLAHTETERVVDCGLDRRARFGLSGKAEFSLLVKLCSYLTCSSPSSHTSSVPPHESPSQASTASSNSAPHVRALLSPLALRARKPLVSKL